MHQIVAREIVLFIPVYGMDNVMKLYKAYHELGGNGTATKLVDDLTELPTEKKA